MKEKQLLTKELGAKIYSIIYLLIFFIKAKGRDEVLKIIKPMNLRLQIIEKKLNIIEDGF